MLIPKADRGNVAAVASSTFKRRSGGVLAVLAVATIVVVVVGVRHIDRQVADGKVGPPSGVVVRGFGTVPAANDAVVSVDFSSVAGVELPDQLGGRTFRTVESGRSMSGAGVVNGRLTHGKPTADNAASYLETSLERPVERIGAVATFADDQGTIALAAWQTSLTNAQTMKIPNAGIHFVASATQWHLSVWDSARAGEDVLAAESYTPVNGPRAPQAFEITRVGDIATVHLPDGQTRTVSDPRIRQWAGANPSWGVYEFKPDELPAAFDAIWAS